MHVKTHACTRACARVHPHTHTHKVFFRDRMPEFVESLAAHCQGSWIQFFKQILKRSYLVNLSKYRFFFLYFVTVPLTLFDLFVVKYGAKCPTSSYKTPVSTCAMCGTLWKVTKFPCDYLARISQVLTLQDVEYLPATLRDGHRLKRQSSFCIIIHENSC